MCLVIRTLKCCFNLSLYFSLCYYLAVKLKKSSNLSHEFTVRWLSFVLAHFKCQLVVKRFYPSTKKRRKTQTEKKFCPLDSGQEHNVEIIIIYNYQCHKFMTCSSINALDSSTTSSASWAAAEWKPFKSNFCPKDFSLSCLWLVRVLVFGLGLCKNFPRAGSWFCILWWRLHDFQATIDSNCVPLTDLAPSSVWQTCRNVAKKLFLGKTNNL